MKNLKKDEVYVVVDTPKKAKKLKKVLDMFGEKHFADCHDFDFEDCVGEVVHFWGDDYFTYCSESNIISKSKVSIKELRNILAKEHLKEGDVVVAGINGSDERWFVKLESFGEDEGFLGYYTDLENSYKLTSYTGSFDNFIRYATEEKSLLNGGEKVLLEPKKELEIGKWCAFSWDGAPDDVRGVYLIDKIEDNEVWFKYGVNIAYNCWSERDWYSKTHNWRLATPQEVEEALIEEAKRRYKIGDAVTQLDEANIGNFPYAENGSNFKIRDINEPLLQLEDEESFFYLGNLLVFKNGVWADVIKQSEVEPKPSLSIGDVVKLNNSQVAVVKDSKEAFRWRFCPKLSKEEAVELLFGKEEEVELIDGNWYKITNRENTLLQYNPNGGAKGWWDGTFGTWAFSRGGGLEGYVIPASDEILKKFGVKKFKR